MLVALHAQNWGQFVQRALHSRSSAQCSCSSPTVPHQFSWQLLHELYEVRRNPYAAWCTLTTSGPAWRGAPGGPSRSLLPLVFGDSTVCIKRSSKGSISLCMTSIGDSLLMLSFINTVTLLYISPFILGGYSYSVLHCQQLYNIFPTIFLKFCQWGWNECKKSMGAVSLFSYFHCLNNPRRPQITGWKPLPPWPTHTAASCAAASWADTMSSGARRPRGAQTTS